MPAVRCRMEPIGTWIVSGRGAEQTMMKAPTRDPMLCLSEALCPTGYRLSRIGAWPSAAAAGCRAARAGLMAALWLAGAALATAAPVNAAPADQPVNAVVEGRMAIHGAAGDGVLAVALSQDWSKPLPGVTRAVVVVHGFSRTAAAYFAKIGR